METTEAGIQRRKAIVEVGPLTANQRLNKSNPGVIILEERKSKTGKYSPVMKAYPAKANEQKGDVDFEVWAEVDMKESLLGNRCICIQKFPGFTHLTRSEGVFVFFDLLGDSIGPEVYTKEKVEKMKG